jgi:hypothetical protein
VGGTSVFAYRLPHRGEVERSGQAQGPRERPPLLGEVDAARVGVHGGTSPRQPAGVVRDQAVPDRDDTQQGGLRRPLPATHAGAHRARQASQVRVYRLTRSCPLSRGYEASPARAAAAGADVAASGSVSLWMSIRQPVSRAASRAFCPSLPIASDSW